MKINSVCVLIGILAAGLQAASAGDISGTVTLKGTPPPETPIPQVQADTVCGKYYPTIPTTHHWVVGPNHELANVVVMLKGNNVSGKSTGAKAEPAVLDQKQCMYGPQILAIQTNQKLLVKNSDPTMHNVHASPAVPANTAANPPNNFAQMQGAPDLTLTFPAPETFMKFQCDVHAWMFSWVTVVDHPWFAVTDKDGKFTIKNVPPGKYTITALHRKAAPTGMDKDVEVKEGATANVDFTLEVPTALK